MEQASIDAPRHRLQEVAERLQCSELVARQLTGDYRVKHPQLRPLYEQALAALRSFDRWSTRTVPRAQNAAAITGQALSGQVTSAQEGAMEGVLVTAKKAGSTIAITVVTNKDGVYSFPASRLEPGQYDIKIRAVESPRLVALCAPVGPGEERFALERQAGDRIGLRAGGDAPLLDWEGY